MVSFFGKFFWRDLLLFLRLFRVLHVLAFLREGFLVTRSVSGVGSDIVIDNVCFWGLAFLLSFGGESAAAGILGWWVVGSPLSGPAFLVFSLSLSLLLLAPLPPSLGAGPDFFDFSASCLLARCPRPARGRLGAAAPACIVLSPLSARVGPSPPSFPSVFRFSFSSLSLSLSLFFSLSSLSLSLSPSFSLLHACIFYRYQPLGRCKRVSPLAWTRKVVKYA